MSTKLHDLSDLEDFKLNQILDEFSQDAVLNGFNDNYVYVAIGRDIYVMDRSDISLNIDVKVASKRIYFFERI